MMIKYSHILTNQSRTCSRVGPGALPSASIINDEAATCCLCLITFFILLSNCGQDFSFARYTCYKRDAFDFLQIIAG